MDCIDARNELLRMFYNDIGVRFTKDKKERMIESEVSSDNQMLLFNISDMLHQWEKASAEINKLFNLNTLNKGIIKCNINILDNNIRINFAFII